MSDPEDRITSELFDWADVQKKRTWEGLLLGNGASIAVWPGFRYASLYEVARELAPSIALTPQDTQLFLRLNADSNFEQVLRDLSIAQNVAAALGQDEVQISERYEHIRQALVAAGHKVHVPFPKVPETTLTHIMEHISEYPQVFSLSYDLLLYSSLAPLECPS